jgi:branched-chain amino acid transport system ATP-binding protein
MLNISQKTQPGLLEVCHLNKHFGGLHAICDVSFVIPDGKLIALIGPNGAGKTTLFNVISNLFPASSGDVRLAGKSLAGLSATKIASLGLIRTFQSARVFPGMTVLENVMVGRHRIMQTNLCDQMFWLPRNRRAEADIRARAEALLEMVGLTKFRDHHAADLPMGAQKMLEVIRAIVARPRILLLDEPAAGLNDAETAELAILLRGICDSGITIMLVEHNMPLVMGIADEVLVMETGRLIMSGKPEEVQRDPRVIAAYLGMEG